MTEREREREREREKGEGGGRRAGGLGIFRVTLNYCDSAEDVIQMPIQRPPHR